MVVLLLMINRWKRDLKEIGNAGNRFGPLIAY